jgi:hypothetical protein
MSSKPLTILVEDLSDWECGDVKAPSLLSTLPVLLQTNILSANTKTQSRTKMRSGNERSLSGALGTVVRMSAVIPAMTLTVLAFGSSIVMANSLCSK